MVFYKKMNERFEERAYVPEQLRRTTIETLPVDCPYFVHTDLIADDEGSVTVDRFWIEDDQLCTSSNYEIDSENAEYVTKDDIVNRVGIMKTFARNGDLAEECYVADLRWMRERFRVNSYSDIVDDEDDYDDELLAVQSITKINAFIYTDEKDRDCYAGPERLRVATEYLAQRADEVPIAVENEAVLVATSETGVSKLRNQQKNTPGKLFGRALGMMMAIKHD